MDVAAWLGGLGLERYAQAFRDAEVSRPPSTVRCTPLPVAEDEPNGAEALSTVAAAGPSAGSIPPRIGIDCVHVSEHA